MAMATSTFSPRQATLRPLRAGAKPHLHLLLFPRRAPAAGWVASSAPPLGRRPSRLSQQRRWRSRTDPQTLPTSAAMEFRFRAGDRRPGNSSPAQFSGPCDQRFPPRAGPFHGDLCPLLIPPFEWEAAAWRERIIREEVERRLLEEEVRCELALSRPRLHGGFGPVLFFGPDSPFMPLPPGTFFGPEGPFVLPPPPLGTFVGPDGPFLPPVPLPLMPVGMHPTWPLPASFGEQEGFDRRVEFEESMLLKRRPLPPPPPRKPKHTLKLHETKPSKSSKTLSSVTKVSGVKRKADVISATTEPTKLQNVISATTKVTELQNAISATTEPTEVQNAARNWSCALCQVTATSFAALNKHRRGRRHLAKLIRCRGIRVIDNDKSGLQAINRNDSGAGPSDAPKKIRILVNGAIHEVVQKTDLLTFATTEPTELQNAISGTTEPAELQNVTFAITEATERQNAAKYWSCAFCQFNATSKNNLKKHRKGKKHLKRKLALYGVSVAASVAGTSDPPKKIHILVDGEMHEVVQQGDFIWCECCSVRCTNTVTMADHLRGKKHSLLNKVWRSIKAVRMKNKSKEDSAATCQGKAIDKDDLPAVSSVLGASSDAQWVQNINAAFSKVSLLIPILICFSFTYCRQLFHSILNLYIFFTCFDLCE
ncbi:hypothetical protein BAE44_0018688 [Dichanthelium oligosanthes]|uniref:C2H2-type domain-containing protein n=1 Tax=Dichanthelium oligosanthes TaxID=888268 RepID=A0A1E5V558_9POAL|nr:hypothetical protein BAE44_0018688 [Dichanthelium oligosanthes]